MQNPIEYASLKDAKVYESIRTLGCNAQVGNYILNALKSSELKKMESMENMENM
ncbi:MAG: hypothetical protein ACI4F8_10795 [Lachnospiraceae bacterium]